ncbi:Acetyltransferase (GNAT) family protein [Andreprevotia lacus DSM 23236]|jgi:GNAT superfamily N-acetyltransferase|uniref:Acetyltransferase (GNAT) family protein n=1 Tax=Andreprevotia lacus DSM 23236 TaxID=1121001 RepID=A0A1W1XYE0_9NEIS|nr:GNAT family N-acetyltransferase [Andreprevotia lacus]SMC28884.1 Acetyltransferase (GNAT) family protein [Andreprevotia lacus DSM 23236]
MLAPDFIERAGQPADARHAAALIYQSDPAYYDYWFALTPELILTNLALLWQAGEGCYSHTRHQVWLRGDQLVAVASHYPAHEAAEHHEALIRQLDLLPLDVSVLHRHHAQLAFLFPHVPPDAWYLRSLAVAPEWRGHGLGSRILRDIVLRADAAGHVQVHTDVDSGNPGAVKFYVRHGFEPIVESRVLALVQLNLPASLRMVLRRH